MLVNQNFMSSLTLVRAPKRRGPIDLKANQIFVFFVAKPSFLRALRELRGAYFFTGNPEQPQILTKPLQENLSRQERRQVSKFNFFAAFAALREILRVWLRSCRARFHCATHL